MITMPSGYYASGRELLAITGKDARDYLQRLLTCNLATLAPGGVIPGALLTGQGKLVGWFSLYAEPGDVFVLEAPAGCAEALQLRLERYVFTEDVIIAPRPGIVLDLIGDISALAIPPAVNTYQDLSLSGQPARLGKVAADAYRLHLQAMPAELPLPALTPETYELWRIERGLPAWGSELNDSLIPLQLGIESAFDHHKGCYPGQEVISRATFVTHPPQRLAGLLAAGPLPPQSELTLAGDFVGVVTSSVWSPERQATIALARIRWQKAPPGTWVQADRETAQVVALPFVGDQSGDPPT